MVMKYLNTDRRAPWKTLEGMSRNFCHKYARSVRPTVDKTVDSLIREGSDVSAILWAGQKSPEFFKQVTTSCLLNVIRQGRISVPDRTLLLTYVAEERDTEASLLLRAGVKWPDTEEGRGAMGELFSSECMPLTIHQLLDNDLIPKDLDFYFLFASIASKNLRLTRHLARHCPLIVDYIKTLSADKATSLRIVYNMSVCRFMWDMYYEASDLILFMKEIYTEGLTDCQFIELVRQGTLLRNTCDAHLAELRRTPGVNPYCFIKEVCPDLERFLKRKNVTIREECEYCQRVYRNLETLRRKTPSMSAMLDIFYLPNLGN